MFLAADQTVLNRLKDAIRAALAWESIVKDVDEGRLNIDQNQKVQAVNESQAVATLLPRVTRECFRWLLCPSQSDPKADRADVEAFPLNTSGGQVAGEPGRVCKENELVIEAWSPIHLRSILKDFYWKDDRPAVAVSTFWEDSLRYLYLPRLKDRHVLAAAVRAGAASRDFFGTAYGEGEGKYEGFQFGDGGASFGESLLLIEPEAATRYDLEHKAIEPGPQGDRGGRGDGGGVIIRDVGGTVRPEDVREKPRGGVITSPAGAASFQGTVEVPAATAKMTLVRLVDEIVNLLTSDPNARVRVTVELSADFPSGVSDEIKRGVGENATSLGFKSQEWE